MLNGHKGCILVSRTLVRPRPCHRTTITVAALPIFQKRSIGERSPATPYRTPPSPPTAAQFVFWVSDQAFSLYRTVRGCILQKTNGLLGCLQRVLHCRSNTYKRPCLQGSICPLLRAGVGSSAPWLLSNEFQQRRWSRHRDLVHRQPANSHYAHVRPCIVPFVGNCCL